MRLINMHMSPPTSIPIIDEFFLNFSTKCHQKSSFITILILWLIIMWTQQNSREMCLSKDIIIPTK